jgi:hypothetical protein
LNLCKELNVTVREFSKHDLNMLTDNKLHQGFVLRARPLTFESIKELPPSDEYKYDYIDFFIVFATMTYLFPFLKVYIGLG